MPKRRWYQFRLRTLFLLMTAFCVVVGPRLDRARRDRETLARIARLPYHVLVYYDFHHVGPTGGANILTPWPGPDWARRLLGDELFMRIEQVYLRGKAAGDADLGCLAPITRDLHGLSLASSSVTNDGLALLPRFKSLRRLSLAHCWKIDDAGLTHLSMLSRLRYLSLSATRITDVGLGHLAGLEQLETLEVGHTNVTVDGMRRLQRSLPNCTILDDFGRPFEEHARDIADRKPASPCIAMRMAAVPDGPRLSTAHTLQHQKRRSKMPGPYHEIYLQQVSLQETGDDNLTDLNKATMVWASPRKIADQLKFEFQPSSEQGPAVTDVFTSIAQKSYDMTPQSIAEGGNINTSYTIYSPAYKNENGNMTQKAIDKVTIARPTVTGLGIFTDSSKAQQRNLANFELFLRVQGTNTTSDNVQMQFFAFNNTSNTWTQLGASVAVGENFTVIYTLVTSQSIAAYVTNGQVQMKVVLYDVTTQTALNTALTNITLTTLQFNAPPGQQSGTLPFDNGTISVHAQPDSHFDYGWDPQESLLAWVEWNVNPLGEGTMDLQISWFNSATGAWELLFEDSNVGASSGYQTASKLYNQCYNDSYQIKASLAGASTIQDVQTLSPKYDDPSGVDTVETVD